MTKHERLAGYCKDCHWKRQEWTDVEDAGGQQTRVLDQFCDVHKTFIPDHGYCWVFEPVA